MPLLQSEIDKIKELSLEYTDQVAKGNHLWFKGSITQVHEQVAVINKALADLEEYLDSLKWNFPPKKEEPKYQIMNADTVEFTNHGGVAGSGSVEIIKALQLAPGDLTLFNYTEELPLFPLSEYSKIKNGIAPIDLGIDNLEWDYNSD